MITHEEARKELRWVDVVSSNNILDNYISQQEQLQAEHEALKKDVARLFELDDKPFELTTDEDFEEMKTLIKEIRKKVGKEE